MYRNIKKKSEGFTIIEVLIVLAIAALIMLIVFLAIPALQRNSRNNGRNSDAARISAAITECLANRNNVVSSCDQWVEIQPGQMNQLANGMIPATATNSPTTDVGAGSFDSVAIGFQRVCTSDRSNDQPGGARSFVVMWVNEPLVARCIDSQ